MDILTKATDLPKSDSDKLKNMLSYLNKLILEQNKKGVKFLKTYGEKGEFGGSQLYGNKTPFVKSVIDELKKAGYNADIHYDCNQFVDIYLLIQW